MAKISFKYQFVVVWNLIHQSVDVNIDTGVYRRHTKPSLLAIGMKNIISSSDCIAFIYAIRTN